MNYSSEILVQEAFDGIGRLQLLFLFPLFLLACNSSKQQESREFLPVLEVAEFASTYTTSIPGTSRADVLLTGGDAIVPSCAENEVNTFLQGLATATATSINSTVFANELNAKLDGQVHGYFWELRKTGQLVASGQSGFARIPDEGNLPWGSGVRMHIASASKLITAMALIRELDDNAIPYSASIVPYLPPHWVVGPGVHQISFHRLLRHISGLPERGPDRYSDAVEQIANGPVELPGSDFDYSNTNYVLARILLATVDNAESIDMLLSHPTLSESDVAWDIVTTNYYREYVRQHIFEVSGVVDASLSKTPDTALAYAPLPNNDKGWDSGNMISRSGSIGWHMTVPDLLAILNAFEQGQIVDDPAAFIAARYGAGQDPVFQSPCSPTTGFFAGGSWGGPSCPRDLQEREINVLGLLPGNYQVSIFMNSDFVDQSLRLDEMIWESFLDARSN